MNVLIVGGGIGGLTTALFLHRSGIPCKVFEAVPRLRELGVGINMLPHAVREFDRLDIMDEVVAAGIPTEELAYFNRHGQLIWSEPRGLAAGYKWPQVSIHRGRLLGVLYAIARKRLGDENILTDRRFVDYEQRGENIVARFTTNDGAKEWPEEEGDLLIAVDGIRSAMRSLLYPDEGKPVYSGTVMYRAVSIAPPFRTGATMAVVGHARQKFISYPLTAPDADGNAIINWMSRIPVEAMPGEADWNKGASLADFIDRYVDWRFDWLDVPALCRNADEVLAYPMVDRDPLPAWNRGRVTLLGDAAHPMYPIGSNGASQAILDASALLDALEANANVEDALAAYEKVRLPQTAGVVLSNRRAGPEIVMEMAEERAPDGFDRIEDVIPRAELEEVAARYKKLARFDKDELNENRSVLGAAE